MPVIFREEPDFLDYNEDPYLGEPEYYSGDECYEEDTMLSGDRCGLMLFSIASLYYQCNSSN